MTVCEIKSPKPLLDTLEHLTESFICSDLSTEQKNDYFHACQFLRMYRGSEATFNAYRREMERLLQWCWWIANKSLQTIKRTDIEQFVEFCQKPPNAWIGTKHVSRFLEQQGERITNPTWRPFVATVSKVAHSRGEQPERKKYSLSQKTLQALFAIIGSFFNYLIQENYVEANPVTQIRQKSKFLRKYQSQPIIRRLSETQWVYVIETAEIKAQNEADWYERTLFIMKALYGMYLRISELAASKRWEPQMGHFQKDQDGNWWFTTVGKGNKQRIISVSDDMLAALKHYREHLNLPPLPYPGETTPLLRKKRGQGPINSTRQIRVIVQKCFDQAIERLLQDNLTEEAEQLKAATVHWLRHTGISDDVKHRPREHVRDDAGHSSSAITDKYIDIELRERHASARKKKINPDA
jgi:site-specific recombinase XerD